ncbi:MAG TPA: zf-HC2 domain-containing protein [Ilumatobacter sp.]|nr:zf-HC2 domain-containing protein [Ilumatobacter sp.]
MANCRETIAELDAFLDGELSDDVRTHIHAHLEGCTDCLSAFDFQAELKAAIRRKCSDEALPTGLLGKIQACFGDVDAG